MLVRVARLKRLGVELQRLAVPSSGDVVNRAGGCRGICVVGLARMVREPVVSVSDDWADDVENMLLIE